MAKRNSSLSPLSQTAPPQEFNLSLNLVSDDFGEPREMRLSRLHQKIEKAIEQRTLRPTLTKKRVDQLYNKIKNELPYSIGIEVTPSSIEKEYEERFGHVDGRMLEMKSLSGEIFHYFNFLIIYNTLMYLLRNKFNLGERSTIDQFFGEFKRGSYIPRDENGFLDITFYSKLIAQKRYPEIIEVDPRKMKIVDLEISDYAEFIFQKNRSYEGDGSEISIQIIALSLRELIYYMNHIEITDDNFRIEFIKKLSRDVFRFIEYGYKLFQIMASLENISIRPLGNEKKEMGIGIMAEQSVILNCNPIESIFLPSEIEFDLSKRKNPEQFISLCKKRFGIYCVLSLDRNKLKINIPPKVNPQLKCKFDLILFQEKENDGLRAEILDHKSSIKNVENESVKINAFIQRVVAGVLLYIKKVRSKDHSPIILGPIDLFDEKLRDIVLNDTRFFLFSPEQEKPREVLQGLDEFTYSEYLLRIIGYCERKALEGELES